MGKGQDTLSGAGQGAIAGSAFGPWGTGAGAVLGGLGGYFGIMPGTGMGDEMDALTGKMEQVRDRYAQYRPEQFARRSAAIQQAMGMMDPSRQMLAGMSGAPAPSYDALFQGGPPGGGPAPIPRNRPQPRSNPAMNIMGTPSGTAPTGPVAPPPDVWRGGPPPPPPMRRPGGRL